MWGNSWNLIDSLALALGKAIPLRVGRYRHAARQKGEGGHAEDACEATGKSGGEERVGATETSTPRFSSRRRRRARGPPIAGVKKPKRGGPPNAFSILPYKHLPPLKDGAKEWEQLRSAIQCIFENATKHLSFEELSNVVYRMVLSGEFDDAFYAGEFEGGVEQESVDD